MDGSLSQAGLEFSESGTTDSDRPAGNGRNQWGPRGGVEDRVGPLANQAARGGH